MSPHRISLITKHVTFIYMVLHTVGDYSRLDNARAFHEPSSLSHAPGCKVARACVPVMMIATSHWMIDWPRSVSLYD